MNQSQTNPAEEVKTFPKKEIEPPKPIEKEKSLLEQVKEIKEFQDKISGFNSNDLAKKSFKFPGSVKRQTRKLRKMMLKSKFQIMLLTLGNGIIPTMGELSMGRIIVGDKYHNGVGVIPWLWNGKVPTFIIAEWDMQPITKETLMETTDELKTHIDPQTITIRAIEAKEAMDKAKGGFNFKGLIVMAIIGIIGYFLFFKGG